MLFLKRLVFKLMELALGIQPRFTLDTRDPVFVNFRLSESEAEAVRRALPAGFELRPIRFAASDAEPAFWLSMNLYLLRYPRPEMAGVRKARCEINTFVRDHDGRDGVFVFCGSPFVSKEEKPSAMGRVADSAERLVARLYGCGKLTRVVYELEERALRIDLDEPGARLSLAVDLPASGASAGERLSDDYQKFNDVSFFNGGKTFDLVSVNSAFVLARFEKIEGDALAGATAKTTFFERAPESVYVHRGEIGYLVSALHPRRA